MESQMNVQAKTSGRAYRALMGMTAALLVCSSVGCVHVSNVFWPNRKHPHHQIMHHSAPAQAWYPDDMSAGFHTTTWHKLPSPDAHHDGQIGSPGLLPIDSPSVQQGPVDPQNTEPVLAPEELPPLPEDTDSTLPSDDDLPPLPDDLLPPSDDKMPMPGDEDNDPMTDNEVPSSAGTQPLKPADNELDFSGTPLENPEDGDVTTGAVLQDESLPIQQPALDSPPSGRP